MAERERHLLAVFAIALLATPAGGETARLEARALDADVVLAIAPLASPRDTRDALADALEEVNELDALLDPGEPFAEGATAGGLALLNRHAGQEAQAVDSRLLLVLQRALAFCRWSKQAFGPLGGTLNGLWGVHRPVGGFPSPSALAAQTDLARCDRLQIDPEKGTVKLAAQSRIDLWGFARGFVVDRAVSVLQERGARAGWVQIGRITRGFGDSDNGSGWPLAVDTTEDRSLPTERLWLKDRALAMASLWDESIEIAGERFAPYVNHRTGRPLGDKVAVLVVAELALDAQALASTLYVLSNREGEFLIGQLRPQPAVKWLLGDGGSGPPLLMERGWAALGDWSDRP